jgi:hypothetical protein
VAGFVIAKDCFAGAVALGVGAFRFFRLAHVVASAEEFVEAVVGV